jgi:peptide/nickel transport system substrate-binding protein
MSTKWAAVAVAVALSMAAAVTAEAKTMRMSVAGDASTMDPHANNAGNTTLILKQIYEPLIGRNQKLEKVPALATEWSNPEPNIWRFKLRQGVKFHDGSPFSADDVVFSITRALAPTSDFKLYVNGIKEAKKVDDFTVDLITTAPNPIVPDGLPRVQIMSKAWAEKNNVQQPQNFRQKEETFAVRNANGTGPFSLRSREPDTKTVLARNTAWWGWSQPGTGNLTEIVFTPINNDATRFSALMSGEIDFVLDPPVQNLEALKRNPKIKVLEGAENRTLYLSMDQKRDELLYSNVKGKNPFKDLRVRQAVYHAIDVEAIKTRVMRGQSVPTGSMWTEFVNGYTKDNDKRLPLDRDKAKKLLADAGYPNGFEVTLDCPNNRYINDEQICIAVAGMLAQVGIKATVAAQPFANFLPKVQRTETSFYLLAWGVPTFDALYTLQALIRSKGEGADGSFNYGNYSNAKVDAMIDQVKSELDLNKRKNLMIEALKLHNDDVGNIPLHHQMIPWAMASNVTAVHQAENQLDAWWVKVD